MSEPLDLEESFQALLARSRHKLGPPPSDDELLRYHRGQSSPEETETIRDYLACDPASMTRFLELTAGEESALDEAPDADAVLTSEEIASDWQAVRRRTVGRRAAQERRKYWAIAALLAVLVLGFWAGYLASQVETLRRQAAEPRLHLAAYVLKPDSPRLGEDDTIVRIRPDERGMHLTLTLFGVEPAEIASLSLHQRQQPPGPPIWSRSIPGPVGDRITLDLPPDFLAPGDYELRLADADAQIRATYLIRVVP